MGLNLRLIYTNICSSRKIQCRCRVQVHIALVSRSNNTKYTSRLMYFDILVGKILCIYIFLYILCYMGVIMEHEKSLLLWRHNERDGFQITSLTIVYLTVYSRRRSKKTSKLRVTGLCDGNSPVTGDFPAQRASNAENVSIWWRHHIMCFCAYDGI